MKKMIQVIQVKARAVNQKLSGAYAAAFAMAVTADAHAQAGGFAKAKGILNTVQPN